ncbi:hypothetical protein ZEAMMB73_Zm00001d022523 [Zea mays]|uniref:Uncharacterized protein n=1 Tax=Zea mays TaxID=4577 RepID=A0A1D6INR8_MAIZE|nr:hypothetical protein ZEAMMB73_Zm00001d022523 [Zea mays]
MKLKQFASSCGWCKVILHCDGNANSELGGVAALHTPCSSSSLTLLIEAAKLTSTATRLEGFDGTGRIEPRKRRSGPHKTDAYLQVVRRPP